MEWKEKVESIEVAIKQLIEEKQQEDKDRKTTGISSLDDSFIAVVDDGDGVGVDRDDDHRQILDKLLSQALKILQNEKEGSEVLESLKAEGKLQQPDPSTNSTLSLTPEAGKVDTKTEAVGVADKGTSGIAEQEIVKELRKIKKQNFITQCLLSAMIVLTVAWQFSEVKLILKVKDRVSHPFKSVGNIFGGMLKGMNKKEHDGEEEQSSIKPKLIEPSSFPGLKISDLPKVELPDFDSFGNRN